jgi:hypothetical protein
MALASVEQISGNKQKFMKFFSRTKYPGTFPSFLVHSEASEKLRTWVKVKKRRHITCNWMMMMFRTWYQNLFRSRWTKSPYQLQMPISNRFTNPQKFAPWWCKQELIPQTISIWLQRKLQKVMYQSNLTNNLSGPAKRKKKGTNKCRHHLVSISYKVSYHHVHHKWQCQVARSPLGLPYG